MGRSVMASRTTATAALAAARAQGILSTDPVPLRQLEKCLTWKELREYELELFEEWLARRLPDANYVSLLRAVDARFTALEAEGRAA